MNIIDTYFPVVKDVSGREFKVLRVYHAIYFILLTVLIGAQSVSKFMMSGMQILLLVNFVAEATHRWILRRQGKYNPSPIISADKNAKSLLAAFLILMAVHLVWMIGTDNMQYGWNDLFHKLPLLAIPVVILASKPLNTKQLRFLLFAFVATVFVATIIGVVRIMTIPDLQYRDTVPFISHIRFSLNICVALVLLTWSLTSVTQHCSLFTNTCHRSLVTGHCLLIVWFVVFLFLLRSYTGIFVLYTTSWIMLLLKWRSLAKSRLYLLGGLTAVTLVLAISVRTNVKDYYGDISNKGVELAEYTANGNPYEHSMDGLVENGNYVNNNVCVSELESQWPNRSKMGIYDTTPNSYTVMPTLVRYLNAKGLTKDSMGVSKLSDTDVSNIEKGVANPVYVTGSSFRKMCYVLLFEYENFKAYGNVRNSSLLERFELWRGAWCVFRSSPLFGVGTGDGVDELHRYLEESDSQIKETNKHAHNQYLTFLVSFGIVGFLIIVGAFVYAMRRLSLRRHGALLAIAIIILLSFISEDTLETLAGCVLCTVIPSLLGRVTRDE